MYDIIVVIIIIIIINIITIIMALQVPPIDGRLGGTAPSWARGIVRPLNVLGL